MDKALLKEEYKRLLRQAVGDRTGSMALMMVLEDLQLPCQCEASSECSWRPAAALAQRGKNCTGTVREDAAVCKV